MLCECSVYWISLESCHFLLHMTDIHHPSMSNFRVNENPELFFDDRHPFPSHAADWSIFLLCCYKCYGTILHYELRSSNSESSLPLYLILSRWSTFITAWQEHSHLCLYLQCRPDGCAWGGRRRHTQVWLEKSWDTALCNSFMKTPMLKTLSCNTSIQRENKKRKFHRHIILQIIRGVSQRMCNVTATSHSPSLSVTLSSYTLTFRHRKYIFLHKSAVSPVLILTG